MSVAVDEIISRSGVVIVLIDIEAGQGVVVGDEVGVVLLDAVIEDGDGHALPGGALQPRLLHVHVHAVATVQVPHLRPSEEKRQSINISKNMFFSHLQDMFAVAVASLHN